MKKLRNILRGRSRRDDRGMTFVEVLCAVAILALLSGVIGTVIVMSTRTYKKGISETNIQQEAQLAANNIGNLVKDACTVKYGQSEQDYMVNGEVYEEDGTTPKVPDGTNPLQPEKQAKGKTELSIITNENRQYMVLYEKNEPTNDANPYGKLKYQEFNADGSADGTVQVMADNVIDFTADTTDFKKSKTIKLHMVVEDEDTKRTIPMDYTMTSRNDAVEGAVFVSYADSAAIHFMDDEVVMVPGETYHLEYVSAGSVTPLTDIVKNATNVTVGTVTADSIEVTVPLNIDRSLKEGSVTLEITGADGTVKTDTCPIKIRRVNRVEVTHTTDTTHSQGGMWETPGTVFTFSASVSGDELVKRVAYDYDSNYKIAQAAAWSCVLKIGSVEQTVDLQSVQDVNGVWTLASADFAGAAAPFSDYFELVETKEDVLVPTFSIRVKKTMPSNMELTVRATSKHAWGVNKGASQYYSALEADPKNYHYGEDKITPRETKLNQGLEIILEPYETGKVKVGMKGGLSSDVTFEYHDASDVRGEGNTNGTIAVYNEADDTVEITLGKNEKGSGKTGADPYTFTVDVKVDGVTKTTIKVRVCRIDEISIEIPKDPWHDDSGNPMNYPTYDFRARFNVDNGSKTDMDKVVKNLIQYKDDGTLDEAAVRRTLSSKITWELIDHNSSLYHKETVTCMAGVGAGDKGEIQGSYEKKYTNGGKTYYEVISVKPARIEQDGNGSWYIKQLPELDISLMTNGTATGLPKGFELKVTIEALHPSGINKTSTAYMDDAVEATVSIFGEMTVETPSTLVIVEPGQGNNSTEQSDKEMVIPITVTGGEVYSMTASLVNTDKTSSSTQISTYEGGNPYKASNITSANKSTWYLGLIIGEDEKGNNNGRIGVHIDAKNTGGTIIGTWDFELGVRRVDNVDVILDGGKKMSAVNKEGGEWTIKATPKGRGSNGTEFYNKQTDESGKAYRWETAGHGEYKEPSPMEWKMVIKGVEKPLSEWTEYFVENSIKTSVNETDHNASVSFKLKKMIPYGTTIRAYSLHARGSNGKTEGTEGYVKYNKSAKKYANTYGELKIVDDGFQRADEFTFVDNIANMREGFTDTKYASEQCSFFRYRIKNSGTWSPYYQLEDTSPRIARFIGTKESLVFLPENDYDLEIINVVYSKSKKLIYWPLAEELLEDGRGWKEEGFRLWNGDEIMKNSDYQDGYKQEMIEKEHALYEQIKTSKEQWKWTFDVPKISINFEIGTARTWNVKDDSVTLATMSESSPLHLQGYPGNVWTPMDEIAVELAPTSFCLWKRQFHMNAYVDQKINGVWTEVAVSDSGWDAPRPKPNNITSNQTYWHLQTSCPQFQIYQIYSGSSAEYRIRTLIKDMEWMKINGRLFNRTYEGYTMDAPLFDLATGEGVLYVKFN